MENFEEDSSCEIKLIGNLYSYEFQLYLHKIEAFIKMKPDFCKHFNVICLCEMEWKRISLMIKRRLGAEHNIWKYKNAIVFRDDKLFEEILYITRIISVAPYPDFHEKGRCALGNYFKKDLMLKKRFVYITINRNMQPIGTLFFRLHADYVPNTCNLFAYRCNTRKKAHSYYGTPIQRIAKDCFIQCGGFNLKDIELPGEGYAIGHKYRGTLSMCNNGRSTKPGGNSTQFFITLDDGFDWMNSSYVVFGELVHGDDVLKSLEALKTQNETFVDCVKIANCGEIVLNAKGELEDIKLPILNNYKESPSKNMQKDIHIIEDFVRSLLQFLKNFFQRMDEQEKQILEDLARYKTMEGEEASQSDINTSTCSLNKIATLKKLICELLGNSFKKCNDRESMKHVSDVITQSFEDYSKQNSAIGKSSIELIEEWIDHEKGKLGSTTLAEIQVSNDHDYIISEIVNALVEYHLQSIEMQ